MKFIFGNCVTSCDTQVVRHSSVLSFITENNNIACTNPLKWEGNGNISMTTFALVRYLCNCKSSMKKNVLIGDMSISLLCSVLITLQFLDMDEILQETLETVLFSGAKNNKNKLIHILLQRFSF